MGHNITKCTADFEKLGDYFSFWENYFMGHFSGYFEGAVILTHCAQILALPLKIFVWPGCPDGIVLEVR